MLILHLACYVLLVRRSNQPKVSNSGLKVRKYGLSKIRFVETVVKCYALFYGFVEIHKCKAKCV